jgi:hypothetical protein
MKSARMFLAPVLLLMLFSHACHAYAATQSQSLSGKTVPKQVQIACDTAHAIAVKTSGVKIQRRTGTFKDELLQHPVFGCRLAISGSFARARSSGDAASRLRQEFLARGWEEMAAYSADGTDGTSFAFRKDKTACLFRGRWDGGSAADPVMPPQDWYRVTVACTSPGFPETR